MKNQRPRKLAFVLMGIGFLLSACGIYGLLRPNEYLARSRVWVPAMDVGSSLTQATAKEIRLIESGPVLSNYACQVYPDSEMTKMVSRLRSQISVQSVPNAKLLDISATAESPESAARAANAAGYAYKIWKHSEWLARASSITAGLKSQLEAQDRKIQASMEALQILKEEFQIPEAEISVPAFTSKFPELDQALRNLADEREARGLIAQKVRDSEAYKTGPLFSVVEIVQVATPPTAPVRRKKLIGLFLIATGMVCCSFALKSA